MNITLTSNQIAELFKQISEAKNQSAQIADEPPVAELPAEYEAIANKIAAKYGLDHMSHQVIEMVAAYDFISCCVHSDFIPAVFTVIAEKVW